MTSRLLTLSCLIFLLAGCTESRVLTIRTKPVDAIIRIDNVERGKGPLIDEVFRFESAEVVHKVAASRLGFKDEHKMITQSYSGNEVVLELKPEIWKITIRVEPGPAVISIDGRPLNNGERASVVQADVDMSLDAKNNPITHVITAERKNFMPARREISRLDRESIFELKMEQMKKPLTITTTPPGAMLFLDGEPLGPSPVLNRMTEFDVDLRNDEFVPRTIRAERPGYDPIETDISWDNGRPDYPIVLGVKTKSVRIFSEPFGATVSIDGKEISPNTNGIPVATLQFPPINDKGELQTYTATIVKKGEEADWHPATIKIGWDNIKTDYNVPLMPVLTQPVEMLEPVAKRHEHGWEIEPQRTPTIAMKSPAEPAGKALAQPITRLARGSQLGSLAVSPDGTQLLFSILTGSARSDFRSQLHMIRTDGAGAAESVSDGMSLDIMPSFTPGGDQIVFSSNRSGKHMNIWRMSAAGGGGITRMSSGTTNDLWPTVDSDPQQRLFYQSMVDTRQDPRVYKLQVNAPLQQTDLASGMQPRISPRNDAILLSLVNPATGKRDIYRMKDRGGVAENLTKTPDIDEHDASWNRDGSRIVFAADRAADEEGRRNYDIWMLDATRTSEPIQLTFNGSRDDCPAFSVTGTSVFFRSNRGGEWGVWKVGVK